MDRRDTHHEWARAQFTQLEGPLLVCEPVLAEVLFLLRRSPPTQASVLHMVHAGALRLAFSLAQEINAVRHLFTRYADVPISLADACVVRMAELHAGHSVCTLDSDFRVYRKHGREPLPVILPPA